MATRTPTRMYGPAQIPDSTTTLYTCPGSTVAVARLITLNNPTGSPVLFTMSIGADAAGTRIFEVYSVAAGSRVDLWGYWVLAAGQLFAGEADTASALVVTIDGDQIA